MMLVPVGEARLNETFDSMEGMVSLGVYYAQIVAAQLDGVSTPAAAADRLATMIVAAIKADGPTDKTHPLMTALATLWHVHGMSDGRLCDMFNSFGMRSPPLLGQVYDASRVATSLEVRQLLIDHFCSVKPHDHLDTSLMMSSQPQIQHKEAWFALLACSNLRGFGLL